MKLRPRQEWGTIRLEPDVYGRSHLGAPLEVWRPAGACELLIFAAIHGEEPETAFALSRALRQLTEPSPHGAVVLAANPDGVIRGTRGNARGVELNRNFPTSDWRPDPVAHRSTLDDPRDVVLSPGERPGSEPETRALMALIDELTPRAVVALHAPLACIDDPDRSRLGRWIAERTGLPLVADVGYPTPGSFGTWGRERGLPVVTYEFGMTTTDALVREHVPVLVEMLTDEAVGRLGG
jgi:protein MpaA